MGRVGSALVDGGAPFGARAAVADNGSNPQPSDQNGFSIVEADSLGRRLPVLDGHPFLAEARCGSARWLDGVPATLPAPSPAGVDRVPTTPPVARGGATTQLEE